MKWSWIIGITLSIIVLIVSVIFLHPDTVSRLETNLRDNFERSFSDSGMHANIGSVSVSLWPLEARWPFMQIERLTDLPDSASWLVILRKISFSNCRLGLGPGLLRIKIYMECDEIVIDHQPLQWRSVDELHSMLCSNFYFNPSDFRDLVSKQGLWDISVRSKSFTLNGSKSLTLDMRYYFDSSELMIIQFSAEDVSHEWHFENEQLRIVSSAHPEHIYRILNPSLFREIML